MSIVSELQKRNVFRVAAAYLVVGWLLTEVLTTLLPELGAQPWVSRAVILLFAIGFVPVVVLSWVYEITPEGIRRESELEDGSRRPSSPALAYATIASAVILAVTLAILGARTEIDAPTARTVNPASVAVLPFVNMSPDEDNEYFSDGLTETLLHMLTQIPDLQVAARTSSFAFKGQNKPVEEIASALSVAHILEGSVQTVGNRVRITAQLIRADDGFHVWSQNYDRELDDIFAIQDEIAGQVGGALSQSLLGQRPQTIAGGAGTDNTDAYDLYLQAISAQATGSFGALQASENLLKGALATDPGFLDAKVQLAANYLKQFETGLIPIDQALQQIGATTDQVLAERPDDPLAQALRIYTDTVSRTQQGETLVLRETIDALQILVNENPTILDIRVLLGRFLVLVQQYDRASAIYEEALDKDFYNARLHFELGNVLIQAGDFDRARSEIDTSLEIEPEQPNAYLRLAQIAYETGNAVEHVRELLNAMRYDPRDHELPAKIATFLYQLDLIDEGDDFFDRVIAIAPTSPAAYQVGLMRELSTGDEVASVAEARRAIVDGIEERNFSYGGAVLHLMRTAAKNGTLAETEAFIEQHAPGIFDVDATAVPPKYRVAQTAAFDAWYQSLPREELLRRVEVLVQHSKSAGIDPLGDPDNRVALALFRGEVDAAIDIALAEVFSRPVTSNLQWRRTYAQPRYAGFIDDARVQAALQEWEAEHAAMRESVRRFLSELSGQD